MPEILVNILIMIGIGLIGPLLLLLVDPGYFTRDVQDDDGY